jgi:hypothetical protein
LAKASLTSGGKTFVMLMANELSPGWNASMKVSGGLLSEAPLTAPLSSIHLQSKSLARIDPARYQKKIDCKE